MEQPPAASERQGKINPVLLLFLIFPLMGIVAAFAIGGQRAGNTGPLAPPVVGYTPYRKIVGNPAPDFTLQTPGGQSIQLSSLRGQWVFLNFWATWCPPCRNEMPTFQRLLNGGFGAAQGKVTVLAVDLLESADQVNGYLKELSLAVPVALDSDGAVNRLYGVVQLPITFVIDPSGVVRREQIGEMTPRLLQGYLDEQNMVSQQR
jgi:peroxiredoxin